MDNLNYNSVLAALNVKDTDRIVLVKENELADSNFVLTHLMKQILANSCNKLCLVTLNNTLKHYVTVGKRLGYDLQKKIDQKQVRLVEPIKSIAEDLGTNYMRFINSNRENITKYFLKNIDNELSILEDEDDKNQNLYLIIDDLSYLLDMNVSMDFILSFTNGCLNIEKCTSIINCHIANKFDEILSNSLEYVADVVVEVSQLKTGRSVDVTGVFTVRRNNDEHNEGNVYHYKTYDRGIKTFKPGETLKFL